MRNKLGRWFSPPQVLRKRDDISSAAKRYDALNGRILNVGSKNVRLGKDCTNFDIVAGPEVDVVGDAHNLLKHFQAETFDTVVLSAMLQYCRRPALVIEQASFVLRARGWLFIDAPFLQPYCPDGPDLWRFTADGLRELCEPHFEVLEVEPSITSGPALAYFAQSVASRFGNRFLAVATSWLVSLVALPLKYWPGGQVETAGAFILVARKR